jgi:hypothetical protein
MNRLLGSYKPPHELLQNGEVASKADPGLENLFKTDLPRTDALRDLADVLEFLRPQLKSVLKSQDEADLFNIANNFGIRHHNEKQKTDYDEAIWLSWIFYYYLATIHAAVRLIEKNEQ